MTETELSEVRKQEIVKAFRLCTGSLVKMPVEMANCANAIAKDYIVYHLEIIDLCHKMDNEFSVLILLQFISSCGMFCFIFYQMYDVSTRNYLNFQSQIECFQSELGSLEFIARVSYMMVIMYQLYRYCAKGDEVTQQSKTIFSAVYECNWIVTSNSLQKTFLLMIMQAQKPIQFTAAKFLLLSLESFKAASIPLFLYNKTRNNLAFRF